MTTAPTPVPTRAPDNLQDVFDRAFADLSQAREAYSAQLQPREVGTLVSVSTGIAKVAGLPGVGFEEVLRFPGDLYGIAFNVDADEIGTSLQRASTRRYGGV